MSKFAFFVEKKMYYLLSIDCADEWKFNRNLEYNCLGLLDLQ